MDIKSSSVTSSASSSPVGTTTPTTNSQSSKASTSTSTLVNILNKVSVTTISPETGKTKNREEIVKSAEGEVQRAAGKAGKEIHRFLRKL